MLDIGWSEFFLIAALALLVLGPRDLTRLTFMLGHWVGQARNAIGELRRAFEDMAEEMESERESETANKIAPPASKKPSKKSNKKSNKKSRRKSAKKTIKPKHAKSKKIRKSK